MSGLWAFDIGRDGVTTPITFLFKQEGDRLTGKFIGAFGDPPLDGKVTGNELKFSYKVPVPDGELTLIFSGIIEKGLMKGSAEASSQKLGYSKVFGEWTAKRK